MCGGHFGKRLLEVLFLHSYSGRMDISMSLAGGSVYAM
jgi:hypothetical protein